MKRYVVLGMLVLGLLLLVQVFVVQADSGSYRVLGDRPINARACPQLNCAVVTTYAPGDVLEVLDTVEGDTVSGSNQWQHLKFGGQDVYVHSSLVAPVSAKEAGSAANSTEPLSTTGWVRYEGNGISIEAPPGWENLSGDEDMIRHLIASSGSDVPYDVLYAHYSNAMFLTEPNIPLIVSVYMVTAGWEQALAMERMDMVNYLRDEQYEFIETAIVDLPVGKMLRVHYGNRSSSSAPLRNEVLEYLVYQDRIQYDLWVYSDRGLSAEAVQVFDAMASTFQISDTAATRHALNLPAGAAKRGQNSSTIKHSQGQFWFYIGDAGEILTLSLTTTDPALHDPYARMIVHAPNGEVIAVVEGALEGGRPQIVGLELPEDGAYEIEVYIFGEYKTAAYKLVVTSGGGKVTFDVM